MTKIGLPFFELVGEEGRPVLLCLCLLGSNLVQVLCWRAVRGRRGLECTSSMSGKILWPGTWDSEICSSGAGEATSCSLEFFFLCCLSQSRLHLPTYWSKCGLNDVHSLITVSVFEVLCLSSFIIPRWPHLVNSWGKEKKKKKEGDLCQVTSLADKVFAGCTVRALSGNFSVFYVIFHQDIQVG